MSDRAFGDRKGAPRPLRATAVLIAALLAFLSSVAGPAPAAEVRPGTKLRKLPTVRISPQEMARFAPDPDTWIERRGADLTTRGERDHSVHRLLGPRMVSRRGLAALRGRGLGPALLEKGLAGLKDLPTPEDPDTLKVLLVRIGFETDRSGDMTSVTTNGDFTFENTDNLLFDPPPHDRDFYLSHLFGLSEYYRMQSGGRLVLDIHYADTGFDGTRSTVLPLGERDSYKLGDIADYGPNGPFNWTLDGIERLVRDMMLAADEGTSLDGSVDLSLYDDDHPLTYVIFVHAGSDWQSDVNADSPNDIPTFFVTLGEPQELPMSGGTLSECSVIPETTTQDGWLGSIAAALYHEFGHALGLADVYNTANGWSVVGVWDLMDSGTNSYADIGLDYDGDAEADTAVSVTGILPPSLGIWNKWFLGWLDVKEVDGLQDTYRLPASEIPRFDYAFHRDRGYDFRDTDPQVLIAGASSREFFLVENRWVPVDAFAVPDTSGVGMVMDDNGVVVYLGGDPDRTGVYRNSGLYDFFLPASGLLVWHVDEDRIEEGLLPNSVNNWLDGIRLVEADGIEDIGHYADPYAWGVLGWSTDPFNAENGALLSTDTPPSSRAFDRSWTGFTMEYLNEVGTSGPAVLRLRARVENLADGSPFSVAPLGEAEAYVMGGDPGPRAVDVSTLTPWTLDDDGTTVPVVVVADTPGPAWDPETPYPTKLLIFGQDGTAPVSAAAVPYGPPGAAWQCGAQLAGPPAVVDLAGGLPPAQPGLVVGLKDGTLLAFADALDAGLLNEVWERTQPVGPGLAFAPAPSTTEPTVLLCCIPPDRLALVMHTGADLGSPLDLVGMDGEPLTGFAAAPLAVPADLPMFGTTTMWAVFGAREWFLVRFDGDGLVADPVAIPYPREIEGTLRRTVEYLESRGLEDVRSCRLILLDDAGLVGAWDFQEGSYEFADPGFTLEDAPVAEPMTADLDGDGVNDLVILTAEKVLAFNRDGVALTGFPFTLTDNFPLPDTTRIRAPAVVCDSDGDGVDEVLFMTDAGHLVGVDARGRLLPGTPFVLGGADATAFAVGAGVAGDDPGRLLWYAEAGGTVHPPLDRRYANGRLAAYRMPGSGTAAQATSEWLGVSGGPARTGTSGEPARLDTGAAPYRAEQQRVVLYPNPCRGSDLNVRFFSAGDRPARLAIYNLEGENVRTYRIPAQAGIVNDSRIALPDLASGVYVCRLEHEGASGIEVSVSTLAVEK